MSLALSKNEWQETYSSLAAQSLLKKRLVFLNAPTGSGKTRFAFKVARKIGKKVLFVTRTHNEFLRPWEESRTLSSTFMFIYGKARLCKVFNEDMEQIDPSLSIQCSLDACPNDACKGKCDCPDKFTAKCVDGSSKCVCIYYPGEVPVLKDCTSPPREFAGKLIRDYPTLCPYHILRRNLTSTGSASITYLYLFNDEGLRVLNVNADDYLFVIDEAHNLNRINETFSLELSSRYLSTAPVAKARAYLKAYDSTQITLKLFDSIMEVIGNIFRDHGTKNYKVDVEKEFHALRLGDQIRLVKRVMDSVSSLRDDTYRLIYRVFNLVYKIFTAGFVPFVVNEDGKLSIVAFRLTPKSYLSIFNSTDDFPYVLFMSGTLPTKEYVEKVWGISRPYDYYDVDLKLGRKKIFMVTDVTSKYELRDDNISRYVKYAEKIYDKHQDGILLYVFPSYEFMKKVMSNTKIPNKLMEDRSLSIERTKDLPSHTVLAIVSSGKFSEGIEITDNGKSKIKVVAFFGVPYPRMSDFLKRKAAELNIPLMKLLDEETKLLIQQAIGRAIRFENDEVDVYFLDQRFRYFVDKSLLGVG